MREITAFQRDFGKFYRGRYVVSASWQTCLSIGGPLGQALGAVFAAVPMDLYGRKTTFFICVLITSMCVAIQFFARTIHVLVIGELLNGLVLGSYVVVAPTCASEICPVLLRGTLTSFTNAAFVVGQLLANIVVSRTAVLNSHWAYSLPFAVQWVWPAIIVPLIVFAPESQWWLVQQGKTSEAQAALTVLDYSNVDAESELALIQETIAHELTTQVAASYFGCFSSSNARRTEIAVGVYCSQVLSGIYITGLVPQYFELAGLTTQRAFEISEVMLFTGLLGTVLSWSLTDRLGRRTLLLYGLMILTAIQLMIGILDCRTFFSADRVVIWSQAVLMIVWNFFYGVSLGPVCFTILGEVPSTVMKAKTIALATAVQAAIGMVMTYLLPLIIAADGLALQGKIGFVFAVTSAVCCVWAYYRVPETAGKTYKELDILFSKNVDARAFSSYKIVI